MICFVSISNSRGQVIAPYFFPENKEIIEERGIFMDEKRIIEPHELGAHEVKYVTMMGSASHNYGNVLAQVQKWVLDKFPDKTFKTIHVQSKLAHRQLLSTPTEFLKKTRPIIVFRPRISYDEQRFLDGTLLTERLGEMYSRAQATDLQPFFQDGKNRIGIKYTLNRYVMFVDVIMVFNTLMQQINYMQFIRNSLRINIPFDINTFLESYLSKDMMSYVSALSGIPLKTADGGCKDFLDYMNSNSVYPVTYKLQGSTGTDEYYRYYPADIITTITDLNADDPERAGHVTKSATINMTLKLEWYSTGFYYLFSDEIHDVPKPALPSDSNLIPIYTEVIMEEDLNLPPGWKMYFHCSCMLDKVRDEVDISGMMNHSIIEVLAYHLKNGFPIEEAMNIRIRRQGILIEEGRDFKVDWVNQKILFNNKSYGFYTYTIMFNLNILYINNLIKEIFKLK